MAKWREESNSAAGKASMSSSHKSCNAALADTTEARSSSVTQHVCDGCDDEVKEEKVETTILFLPHITFIFTSMHLARDAMASCIAGRMPENF
jgi:tryptophanyl-tRNA synthetase